MAHAAPGADLDITEELPVIVLDSSSAEAEVAAASDALDITEELPVVRARAG